MSKYCTHCGHKQESQNAKFCSSCGEPLSGITKAKFDKPLKGQIIGEDETDIDQVPVIDKFEVDVEIPSNVVKISNKDGQLVFESSKFEKRTLELE
jgi:hypothetical protein